MYNISVSVVNEADVLVIVPGYKQIAYTTFWGAEGAPILFSDLGFCIIL